MHTQRTAIDVHGSNGPARDLHLALVGGLRTPLAALRASMEALAHRFEERDPRSPQVLSSLAQVVRIQHHLQTILDAEHPTALRPLSCTLQEIVASAVNALVPEHRARVLVAVEDGDARFVVDGPLVSRALTRLLECGLDQGTQPALLRVHAEAGRASFGILHPRFDVPQDSIEALAAHVAERDIRRMGGTFRIRSAAEARPGGAAAHASAHAGVIEVVFELAAAGEEAA